MNIKVIYIGAAVAVLAFLLTGLWSGHKLSQLSSEAETAKKAAEKSERIANDRELEAAAYKSKIEYLEGRIADIEQRRKEQDEKLSIQNVRTRDARRDVERARGVRAIGTDERTLCKQLAELGHACE